MFRRFTTICCVFAVASAGCARKEPESPAAATSEPGVPASAPAPGATTPEEPPADSGLAVKRGVVMLAQDRSTFRICGETAELWLIDQTDGVLTSNFTESGHPGPTMLYVEAYGERGPVAAEVSAARAYAGTFVLEDVLYATQQQGQSRGCDAPVPTYLAAARGNEPSWSVEVFESEVRWRQADGKDIGLLAPTTQDTEGAVRYEASGAGHRLELSIDQQSCRDSMSGEYFAYAAKATFDGKQYVGCARVGQ